MNKFSLNQRLSIIGIRLANTETKNYKRDWVDIEKVIYDASLEVPEDSRLFFLLCSWVSVHGDHVIIEKLLKYQKENESKWLIALSIFAAQNKKHKWKILLKKIKGKNSLSPIDIAQQAISFKGRDEEFYKYGFWIPKGTIRVRESDVASRERLISENVQYKNRFLFGSNWRADIITAIQLGIENPYRISKLIDCSYPSAYRVFNEYKLVSGA